MPSRPRQLRLSVPADTRFLALMRQTVAEACRAAVLPDTFTQTVVSAVSEGCNNAIEHAYGFDESGRIDLTVKAGAEGVRVEIEYLDEAFDPDTIPAPRLGSMQEGGYGVFLMRQLMDRVEYRKEAGGRIRLCLLKAWKDGRDG